MMIEVKDLCKTYDTRGSDTLAIENLSFDVAPGEFVSVIGPSGSGKTTLLKIIGDLIKPTSGEITIDGMSKEKARQEKMFSFVFQKPVLLPWRTVIDNVRLPLEIVHQEGRDASDVLDMVGLLEFKDKHPNELSGGMEQRVALARALTFNPKILLMDEPFSAVDEFTRHTLNGELLNLWQAIGVTILFVTHSISEAVFLSDRVFVLSKRPAKMDYVLEVPFSRPRDQSIKGTPEFQEVVECLRKKLE